MRKNTSIQIWDNEGKTYDRYIVIINDHHVYTMSDDANTVQGVCSYQGDAIDQSCLEEDNVKVELNILPKQVQKVIHNLA